MWPQGVSSARGPDRFGCGHLAKAKQEGKLSQAVVKGVENMALLQKGRFRVGPLTYSQNCQYNGMPRSSVMLLRDRLAGAKNLFRKDLKGHFGCVNAIEFSHGGGETIASGKSGDMRV